MALTPDDMQRAGPRAALLRHARDAGGRRRPRRNRRPADLARRRDDRDGGGVRRGHAGPGARTAARWPASAGAGRRRHHDLPETGRETRPGAAGFAPITAFDGGLSGAPPRIVGGLLRCLAPAPYTGGGSFRTSHLIWAFVSADAYPDPPRRKGGPMDRNIRTVEDVLRLLDGLFAPDADRWTADGGRLVGRLLRRPRRSPCRSSRRSRTRTSSRTSTGACHPGPRARPGLRARPQRPPPRRAGLRGGRRRPLPDGHRLGRGARPRGGRRRPVPLR